MPKRDGTGPTGQSPGTGRGLGRTQSQGQGRDGMGGPFSADAGGICICPRCGHKAAHVTGQPCIHRSCPRCGAPMTKQ